MIKVALVRGAYLNNFEGQNYIVDSKQMRLSAVASLRSIHASFPFPVIRLPSLTDIGLHSYIGNRLLGDRQILWGLERYAADFDIFHTADSHYYYSYQLAKLRQVNKIRCLIATSWETIPFNNETVAKKKQMKRFTQHYIDHFICYTNRAKQCLVTEGVNPQKITVIRLGVDIKLFKSKKTIRSRQTRILFAGRKVGEKGYGDLIEAVQDIKNIKLVFTNNVAYHDMPHAYQSSDILVMPSKSTKTWEEQYGMVLVEGMASGLSIIAYRSGAIPEVLGSAGLLLKEGDTESLRRAITQLATNPLQRTKLGTMARRRAVKYFDSRQTAKKIERLYSKLI